MFNVTNIPTIKTFFEDLVLFSHQRFFTHPHTYTTIRFKFSTNGIIKT